jgi:hypothetical protein
MKRWIIQEGVHYSVGREVVKGKLQIVQGQFTSRQFTTRSFTESRRQKFMCCKVVKWMIIFRPRKGQLKQSVKQAFYELLVTLQRNTWQYRTLVPDLRRNILPTFSGQPWRWKTHVPPHHWYPRTKLRSSYGFFKFLTPELDCLCGLVVRVPGYISRDPGFDSRSYQIFWEIAGLNEVHSATWG